MPPSAPRRGRSKAEAEAHASERSSASRPAEAEAPASERPRQRRARSEAEREPRASERSRASVPRAADAAHLLLRAALAVAALALPLEPLPYREVVQVFSLFFALGLLVRVFATTLWLRLVLAAALEPGGLAVNGELLGIAAMCTGLFLLGAGPYSLDAKLAPRFPRLARPMPAYAPYVLRMGMALALLTQGLLLLLGAPVLFQALGVAWLLFGAALAVGFLTPWAALLAAPLWLLALPFGFPQAVPLALGALALAAIGDTRLALDARLQRRGGLFPRVRHEVVLDELERR